jgi:sec-independent protein translocase protein TatA
MFGIGTTELVLIVIVLVLLFCAKKIPDLAKGIGDSIRRFKGALKEDDTKK